MTEFSETIRRKLEAAFSPVYLEIIDQSAAHAGHTAARPGGESHFRIRIVSAHFSGRSRLDRQRGIYAVLSEEMAHRIHALSVQALTPEEQAQGAMESG